MPKLEWNEDGALLEIETNSVIRLSHPHVAVLDQEVTRLARNLDYSGIILDGVPPIGGNVAYLYEITHKDARKFCVTVIADNASDPLLRFGVADDWRISELKNLRVLLDLLLVFLAQHQLIKFTVVRL